MRGRVAALLLLLSPIAYPQCNWTPRFSGQFRTTALDVSVDGSFVWLATGYGVQLLENNAVAGSVAIPGPTRVIAADGTGLAYAGSGARLYVLRRDGRSIRVLRSIAASGSVNDIAVSSYLFVATANGIDHFDRIDPEHPVKTSAFLATSAPNVTSLALDGAKLYAADGDTTLETFSLAIPSIPQNTGSLDTVRASSVHVTPDHLVLASDNLRRNTDLFSGTTRLARLPFAATSFASSSGAQFVAGPDRTLLAVDLSNPNRIAELFEHQLPPTDGTDNAIHAIERAGNTLYVAAGDIGLATFDVSSLARPWPLVSYAAGATTSVRALGDKAWFTDAGGRVSEHRIVATGLALNEERSWSGAAGSLARDVDAQTLLTTSGSTATLWSLGATPPASATIAFAANILNAAIRGAGVVALLADGSVWTAQPSGSPAKLALPKTALLARSGNAYAFAEVNEQTGKTTVHWYANGDFTAEARRFTVDGAPVGNLALGSTRAALFTFKGINVIDLATGNVTIATDSNRIIPRQLALSGTTLLAADSRTLLVYDDARTLVRRHAIPANIAALDAVSPIAVMATNEGSAAATFLGAQPAASTPFRSAFYTKLAAGGDRVYLVRDDGIDIFRTASNDVLAYAGTIATQGIVDVAATSAALYVLGGSGTIASYSPLGAALAQTTMQEGNDAQPRAIATAGKAVWVSLSKGCSSGACEKKTLVLDPASLVVTASMSGGVDDVVTAGTRAYALVDLPREVRILNIADPLHPAPLASIARPASSVSLAAANGKVYVLGEKVSIFDDTTLAASGEALSAAAPNDATRIRAEGTCAVITGRGENAETFRLPSFTSDGAAVELPSSARSFALQAGRLIVLTGHSVELWSSAAPQVPSKRRSARP